MFNPWPFTLVNRAHYTREYTHAHLRPLYLANATSGARVVVQAPVHAAAAREAVGKAPIAELAPGKTNKRETSNKFLVAAAAQELTK